MVEKRTLACYNEITHRQIFTIDNEETLMQVTMCNFLNNSFNVTSNNNTMYSRNRICNG